jgi:hypothetical protein
MFKGVCEQVEAAKQEQQRKKTDQATESADQSGANDQRFHDVVSSDAYKIFVAHGSPLAGGLWHGDGHGIFDAQKLKIGEIGRRIFLLHGRAAGTARITSIDITVRLNQDFEVTRWIDAMPLFPCFHDHVGRPFFCCRLAGIAEEAAEARAHSK